jgi:hypothetical protein
MSMQKQMGRDYRKRSVKTLFRISLVDIATGADPLRQPKKAGPLWGVDE